MGYRRGLQVFGIAPCCWVQRRHLFQKFLNLERPPDRYFDLDQTSEVPHRYRGWRIRGTHDRDGVGPACRVVSLSRYLLPLVGGGNDVVG